MGLLLLRWHSGTLGMVARNMRNYGAGTVAHLARWHETGAIAVLAQWHTWHTFNKELCQYANCATVPFCNKVKCANCATRVIF